VTVGGGPGSGRTDVASHLAIALSRSMNVVLLDADDVAPAVAQRWNLPIEPNLCTAIDAVEHGRGALDACLIPGPAPRLSVLTGIPNAGAWEQVRPGEVVRVVERLSTADIAVADGAGTLDEISAAGRGRFATGRALVVEADILVAVVDASPTGVTRFLTWAVAARSLASDAPIVVFANRAPASRFRRGEIYAEITGSLDVVDVVFAPHDARVTDAAWEGRPVARGPFVRAAERTAALVVAA
jgi:MinD superfamily P-loop ATPase